eukprot:1071838-Rhodomonas_salina.5
MIISIIVINNITTIYHHHLTPSPLLSSAIIIIILSTHTCNDASARASLLAPLLTHIEQVVCRGRHPHARLLLLLLRHHPILARAPLHLDHELELALMRPGDSAVHLAGCCAVAAHAGHLLRDVEPDGEPPGAQPSHVLDLRKRRCDVDRHVGEVKVGAAAYDVAQHLADVAGLPLDRCRGGWWEHVSGSSEGKATEQTQLSDRKGSQSQPTPHRNQTSANRKAHAIHTQTTQQRANAASTCIQILTQHASCPNIEPASRPGGATLTGTACARIPSPGS